MPKPWLSFVLALSLILSACQLQPLPATQQGVPMAVQAATLTIDRQQAVELLGNRPNALWQDTLYNARPVRERRQRSSYRVQTATAANAWTTAATLPSASTNGLAYAHLDTSFGIQNPNPGEVVFAVCDNGTVRRLDPTNNGATISPDFTALTGLAGVGTVTRSALALSSDNDQIFLLTTGGYLVVLDAHTGARQAAVKLSNAGFANIAPVVDYSQGGAMYGQPENLYALAADGSVYRCQITPTAVNVWGWRSRNGGTNGNDAAALGTNLGATSGTATITKIAIATVDLAAAGVTTTTFCKASPVVWNGEAIFGASNGWLYRLRTAANAVTGVVVSNYGIETTPAVDFNAAFTAMTEVFVPAGDRLHWIDASGATLARKSTSPPLVLDKKPPSLTSGTSGKLSAYTYAATLSTLSYNAADWTAACTNAVASDVGPTRWGGGAADLGAVTLSKPPYGVTYNPLDNSVWATLPAANKVVQVDASSQGITATYDGNGNYAALVKTVPVGANGQPTGLAPDPTNGGVWVSCYGANQIKQIDAGGTVVRTITGIPGPTDLCYDDRGTASTADDQLWIASATGTGTAPTGALLKLAIAAGTYTSYTNTNTDAAAKRYTNPSHNLATANPAVTAITSASWAFRGPQGVAMDGYGRVWVANSWENMDSTQCNFCGSAGLTTGYPFNVDGHSDPAFAAGANSSILVFDPSSSTFKAQVICTGAPYNMQSYFDGTNYSMWCATYRWGIDTTSRFGVTSNITAATSFKKLYETWQNTGNHWQPHWVAVDQPNNQVWIVNGDADTAFTGNAPSGLDRLKATAAHTGVPTSNNAGMTGTNPDFLGTYQTGAQPRGVAIDSNGNCWVANASDQSCTKYSKTGVALGTYPVGNTPWCVACDKFDVTWVCNRTDNTVSRITAATMPPAPLVTPRGVALDANNNLWIANSGDNTMTVLDQTGNTVYLKLSTGTTPNWVEKGAANTVWVANAGSSAVNRFTLTTPPTSPASVNMAPANPPGAVGFTSAGNAYISVPNSNYVVQATAAGVLGSTISTGAGSKPAGIDVDQATNNVWVADQGSNNVSYIPAAGTMATQFAAGAGPTAVAVKNNLVWVANTGANTLMRVNAKTGGGRVGVGVQLETLAGFNGASAPGQMAVDANDNLWVANTTATNKLTKIWGAGAQDLMAAGNYRGTDGNASYMYFRFPIATGNFGGKTVVGANVKLTSRTASAMASETLKASGCDVDLGGGLWGGFNGANNVDWNNAPAVGAQLGSWSGAIASATTVPVPVGGANTPLPGVFDFPNTPYDAANGLMAFAVQSAGNALADVAHWSTATKPQLEVSLTATKLGASGMRSQPTIDSINQRVYVLSNNVLCELRYDSPANFADPAQIAYSYTKQGLSTGSGPVSGTTYITPTGAALLTETNRLAVIDFDNASTAGLSCFSLGMSPLGTGFFLDTSGNNSTQLTRTYTLANQASNTQLMYDYDHGSIYMASGTSVYAFKLLQ
jgi:DNA-binding beta-propeller fold protein YncE